MATKGTTREIHIDDALLEWLDDTSGGTVEDFQAWAEKRQILCLSIELAAALTRLVQKGRVRIVAPFGKFVFAKG